MSSIILNNQSSPEELIHQLRSLFQGESNPLANMANMSSFIYWSLPNLNWVGFYLRQKNDLVVGPFHGKPACVRIPFGRGVCGAAAQQRKIIVVDDVHKFHGHIVCDEASQSEIVLPMFWNDEVIGVFDVDSPVVKRFGEGEKNLFEECVSVLINVSDGWEKYFVSYKE